MTVQEDVAAPGRKRRKNKPDRSLEMFNEHAKRTFCELKKDQPMVPFEEYQRDESQGRIAAEIALHFDWVAFGALTVIHRADGQFVVADGGTRLAGARQRNDVMNIPCMVYSGLSAEEEADIFLRINNVRRRLRTEQLHKAELFTHAELAVLTQNHLDYLQQHRVGFDSMRTMRSCCKTSAEAAARVTTILSDVAKDKHLTARVMKGLFRLELMLNKDDRTLNRRATINRMREEFHSFDAVVNAMVKPRSLGNTTDMARALARTLRIKLKGTAA